MCESNCSCEKPALKFEVGKKYMDRSGVVWVVYLIENNHIYVYLGLNPACIHILNNDGSFSSSNNTIHDLVSEYMEPSKLYIVIYNNPYPKTNKHPAHFSTWSQKEFETQKQRLVSIGISVFKEQIIEIPNG